MRLHGSGKTSGKDERSRIIGTDCLAGCRYFCSMRTVKFVCQCRTLIAGHQRALFGMAQSTKHYASPLSFQNTFSRAFFKKRTTALHKLSDKLVLCNYQECCILRFKYGYYTNSELRRLLEFGRYCSRFNRAFECHRPINLS